MNWITLQPHKKTIRDRTPFLDKATWHLLVFTYGLLSWACSTEAADWPMFLGPTANGISQETELRDNWPTNGPPQLWAKDIGTGYSAPSLRGETLILHHRLGNEEIIEALQAADGKPIWKFSYPSFYRDPFGYNNGPRCTPLLSETHCYTFGVEGKLTCLDLATGKKIWQRDTAKDFNIPEAFFGVGSTPLLEGNRLIVMIGGQPNAGMAAFDIKTGKTLWQTIGRDTWEGQPKTGWRGEPLVDWKGYEKQASYASPVAATIHGQRHILCFMRQGLVSLNPETGQVNFSFWFRARVNESVNAMNPIVQDDLILISGAYYRIGAVLLQVQPDGKGVQEVWRNTVLEIHWTTPILHQGHVYAFSGRNEPDAQFRCVELKTGRLKWNQDERWVKRSTKQPDAYGRGSAIMADGKLIVLGEGGKLGMFHVNAEEPKEICSFQVPQMHYPSWTAPVLASKRLYLRCEDALVCLDLKPE